MSKRIKLKDFENKDNLGQCECGNWSHNEYLVHDSDGASSCPNCQTEYMSEQIAALLQLVKEIADPAIPKKEVLNMVKDKYRIIYGLDSIDKIDFLPFLNDF